MNAMSFFFFKQKTAYEMRISDWSSDVCSSDLIAVARALGHVRMGHHEIGEAEDLHIEIAQRLGIERVQRDVGDARIRRLAAGDAEVPLRERHGIAFWKIGRASCRERVCQYV